jgi:oligopeptide/dipeptide ABC transporter ATP-binding protein
MVFQDPYQSLNPRQRVSDLVLEPLRVHKLDDREARARVALEAAGLTPAERYWSRYPHELSGGQRQRVAIACAMALEPEGLVCDEPVSALDVSVRAQVLQVLLELRERRGLGLLFITHDIGLAWSICDRIAVMYLGRIVELGATRDVVERPQHPYTQALVAVAPRVGPRRKTRRVLLRGELPDAANLPGGCRFHPRCPRAGERCRTDDPQLAAHGAAGQQVACWYPGAPAP